MRPVVVCQRRDDRSLILLSKGPSGAALLDQALRGIGASSSSSSDKTKVDGISKLKKFKVDSEKFQSKGEKPLSAGKTSLGVGGGGGGGGSSNKSSSDKPSSKGKEKAVRRKFALHRRRARGERTDSLVPHHSSRHQHLGFGRRCPSHPEHQKEELVLTDLAPSQPPVQSPFSPSSSRFRLPFPVFDTVVTLFLLVALPPF